MDERIQRLASTRSADFSPPESGGDVAGIVKKYQIGERIQRLASLTLGGRAVRDPPETSMFLRRCVKLRR